MATKREPKPVAPAAKPDAGEVTLREVGEYVVVMDSKGNPTEIYKADGSASGTPTVTATPGSSMPTVAAAVGKVGAVAVDAKHPYVVAVSGMPLFCSSSPMPDRLAVLIAAGINPAEVQVLDTRTGSVAMLKKKGA